MLAHSSPLDMVMMAGEWSSPNVQINRFVNVSSRRRKRLGAQHGYRLPLGPSSKVV
jgi:hypothetical protein